MNLKQTVYFMSLVGALAGLVSWFLQAWLSDVLRFPQEQQWILLTLYTLMLGTLIGGLTVGFGDHWTSDRVLFRWILMGALLGFVAGGLSGLIYIPILYNLILPDPLGVTALMGRVAAWIIAGGLIGFVTGLRWFGVNKLRAVHAMLGGMVGGGLGGLVFSLAGSGEFFQALAFVLTGLGITLGVTLAPMLLRDGVLQFISSGDARAQNKYASPRQEWLLQDGDRFVIGSLGADMSATLFSRAVQVYLPDAMVAPRHAVLFARSKRFYIQQHPDNVGLHGQPNAPLQVGNVPVNGTVELRDGDDLLIGQTLLRFYTRKKRSTPGTAAPRGSR